MPIYKYTTLDDPLATGTTGTNAVGINNAGQIVGEYTDNTGFHGFLLSGGTYTTLNDPLAPNFTEAFGINSAGQIVGDYVPGGGFLLTGGTYTTLNPPGSVSTIAEDINSKGQIVGWYYTSGSDYLTHGFIRLSDGSYLTYDDPYAGTSSLNKGTHIRGVNDALAIVGGYYDGANQRHGYFIQGLFTSPWMTLSRVPAGRRRAASTIRGKSSASTPTPPATTADSSTIAGLTSRSTIRWAPTAPTPRASTT